MNIELNIDIETYSPVDLKKSGVYPYANHPEFEILLFAFAFGREEVTVVDLKRGQKLPERVMIALYDERTMKTAFNALFERTCINVWLSRQGLPEMPIPSWECTMIKSAMLGLPLSLGKVAEVLNLPQQKMGVGLSLIRFFCIPCKPTKANGMRTRNLPEHDMDKWHLFMKYCGQDVNTERNIRQVISAFKIPETEKLLYALDQEINDRGVLIDRNFVEKAIAIDIEVKERLVSETMELTGMNNPKSGPQLKAWLLEETEEEFASVTKATIPDIIKKYPQETIKRVLALKLELNKTSVMKYKAMMNAVCSDNRIRGLTQFYGANRTGRWSGRLVQTQNLPQNHIENLDLARDLVLSGDASLVEMFYGNVPDTLSQLIRTSFIPSPGNLFYVADFSAIEARVLAWLADEKWIMDVFATHGKIYEATASKMFHVPIEAVTKGSEYRQKGKISSLALQYQGSVGALDTMGARKMGIPEDEWQGIVDQWRAANPNIVNFWYKMNSAALSALSGAGKQEVAHGVYFEMKGRNLYMYLPSGRRLCYLDAYIGVNRFGSPSICYYGMDQETKKWGKQETYGGKLSENCLTSDTFVLTLSGWKRIIDVTIKDLLWDGQHWVRHEGLIYKGIKQTLRLNGVGITPDHKILTIKGWENASQGKRYNRVKIPRPDRYKISWLRWFQIIMGFSMRLRKRNNTTGVGVQEEKIEVLRMPTVHANIGISENARKIEASDVLGVAFHESKMHTSDVPSVAQLRGPRNYSVRSMAAFIRELLGGYGRWLRIWSYLREKRRQRKLHSWELHMGINEEAIKQQKMQRKGCLPGPGDELLGSFRFKWHWANYIALQIGTRCSGRSFVRSTGYTEPVYDLMNAGPNHRFVVKSENGDPFIAHNCTQAVARDCLAVTMLNLNSAKYPIVFHVHDEVIIDYPDLNSYETLKNICRIMGEPIPWAPGLLLKADGYTCTSYRKD